MADKSVDPVPVKKWQKDLKMEEHDIKRGSRYPPFNIEPLPYERQRLSGTGMTDGDRVLRRQWLKDQELSPNEPRVVNELKPKNIFKRIYNAPMNALFQALKPILGEHKASVGRVVVPRLMLIYVGACVAYYQLKYHPNDWTKVGGFHVYTNKPMVLNNDASAVEKTASDFCERGFKTRTVLLDGKTSRVE